jgi:hypothetical protein
VKPLELTIYPPLKPEGGRPRDLLKHEFAKGAELKHGEAKRLTPAELAAEYYRACYLYESDLADNDGYDGMPEVREHRRQSLILHRFAKLPHYDEVTK